VRVTCPCCHADHHIGTSDVLLGDAQTTCSRYAATIAYPSRATRIRCPGCGLFLIGPT
jgi:hypothetical protein